MVVLKMKIKPCEMILSSSFVGSRTELPPPLVPGRVLSRLSFRCVCIHFQAGVGLQVFSSGLVHRNNPISSPGAPILGERETEKLLGDQERNAIGTRGHQIQEGILEEVTFQLSEEGQSESGLAKKQEEILGSWKEEETGHWTQRGCVEEAEG